MTPKQRNTRTLIGVLAEHFPAGSDCMDLRLKFEQVANRKAATFYTCLHLARANGWVVQDDDGIYTLSLDGGWRDAFKPPSVVEELERLQHEHVLAMREERIEKLETINRRLTDSRKAIAAGEVAGPAIGALVSIMSDPTVSIAKRISAAQSLLEYKSPPEITESAKRFLASIFTDPEMNVDHRLAATTALRRSEDARIMPPIERPPARIDDTEPPEPLRDLVARRRERADRMEREMALQLERDMAMYAANGRGNGGDEPSKPDQE
jgi:hypothetical protein